jgi:hypothetical protein
VEKSTFSNYAPLIDFRVCFYTKLWIVSHLGMHLRKKKKKEEKKNRGLKGLKT